jgi:hypothetical protein
MSLSLISYPVFTESGDTINIFPGYLPIELEFKREDIAIISVTAGSGTNILVTISGDFTSIISEGDGMYVNSSGSDFTYDDTGTVQSAVLNGANTDIEIDIPFIEIASGGYLNYKQNYSVELIIINFENPDIDLLGFSLFDDGTPSGVIKIDTSIIVDQTRQSIIESTQEVEESRIKYNVKYREVWKDNESEAFTAINNPIIAFYATEDLEQETFVNPMTTPKYWLGYPQGVGFLHSDADDAEGESQRVLYDELNLNQETITADNLIKIFDENDYGLLFSLFPDVTNADVRFLRMKTSLEEAPEYEPTEYDNNEYET